VEGHGSCVASVGSLRIAETHFVRNSVAVILGLDGIPKIAMQRLELRARQDEISATTVAGVGVRAEEGSEDGVDGGKLGELRPLLEVHALAWAWTLKSL
jgi:hypothetical protein